MRGYSILSATVVLISLFLSACAGGDSEDKLVVGYAASTLENPFFVGLQKGVRDGAREQGFELSQTNANGDAGEQFNQVNNLIQQDVDALLLNPIDANGIVPAVQAANNADIPVFTLDRGAEGGEVVGSIETNNVEAGKKGANYIVELLEERYGEPRGNIADLQGLVGTTPANDRETGFQQVMQEYPEIEIVANQPADFNQEQGLNVTADILQANQQLDAIFAANDDSALGALRAIDSANLSRPPESDEHIIVIGIDGSAQALDAIRKGRLDATVSQNPVEMGQDAMRIIRESIVEEKEVPKTTFYPTILITPENINSKKVKDYGLWAEEVE